MDEKLFVREDLEAGYKKRRKDVHSSPESSTRSSSMLRKKRAVASRRKLAAEDAHQEHSPEVQSPSPSILPGSYAIKGIDYSSHMDEDIRDDLSEVFVAPENLQNLVDAELVDPKERKRERDTIRQETLAEVQAKAQKAVVVDESAAIRKRQRLWICMGTITCMSVAMVIVMAYIFETRDPTQLPKRQQVEEAVRDEFGDYFENVDTPQHEAVNWMVVNDTLVDYPLEGEQERAIFRQRYAMCVLAFATDVDAWKGSGSWLDDVSECTWSGLTCDRNDRLIGINLAVVDMNGTLPTELGVLTDLKHMFMYENPELKGAMPTEIGRLSALETLYLQDSGLSGSLPLQSSQLDKLQELNLANNQITGTIHDQLSLWHEMRLFDLSNNMLSGTIPNKFWHLQRLKTLKLQNNQLTGTLSTHLGSMISLNRIEVQNNQLTGTIPTELAALDQLQVFRASDNQLNGAVPAGICTLQQEQLSVLELDCAISCSCCTGSMCT